jgi:hypothetical protein
MRFLISLFLLFVIAKPVPAQFNPDVHHPEPLSKINLTGTVSSIKIEQRTVTNYKDFERQTEKKLIAEAKYDKQGKLIEHKEYSANGKIRRINSYTYQNDVLVKLESQLFDKIGFQYRIAEYKYDILGNIQEHLNRDFDDTGKEFRKTLIKADPISGDLKFSESVNDAPPQELTLMSGIQLALSPKEKEFPAPAAKSPKKILPLKRRLFYETKDTQGNWTKMSEDTQDEVFNGNRAQTKIVTYRTITYF